MCLPIARWKVPATETAVNGTVGGASWHGQERRTPSSNTVGRDMRGKNGFQFCLLAQARQHLSDSAAPIQKHQCDISNVVAPRKKLPLGQIDVRDEIDKIAFLELPQRAPRLALQRGAGRTLWVVNLHDSRLSIPDLR